MSEDVYQAFAARVIRQGWPEADAWLRDHHGDADRAALHARLERECRDEARASLIVLVTAIATPVLVIAAYQVLGDGIRAATGGMAGILILILIALVAAGALGAWQSWQRHRTLAR